MLETIDETPGILAPQASVLLVMKRDAEFSTLIAHETNSIHIQKTAFGPAFTPGNNPIGFDVMVSDNTDINATQ